MQKRSNIRDIQHHPIALNSSLPISGGEHSFQQDSPITYLHYHNCLEVGYCYSGSGIFVVGEKILPFHAGDVVFINRSEAHLARSSPGTHSEWAWVYLDPVSLAGGVGSNFELLDPSPFCGPEFHNIISPLDDPQIGETVKCMVAELASQANGRAEMIRALVWQLMVRVRRIAPDNHDGGARVFPDYERVAPALQYMANHLADPLDVNRLARLCSLSAPHFRRIFGNAVGRSPRAYWHALRMRMAASLLRESKRSILEISQEVGFDTLSSFNRQFLKHFGRSPREWRRGQISTNEDLHRE